ncbi:hypothetical protein H2203_004070 [Taxawa tesnikishii (nom. ined.)]|nr:hypothetical protein H2203_004070 [Dothideales sp. JES 119]
MSVLTFAGRSLRRAVQRRLLRTPNRFASTKPSTSPSGPHDTPRPLSIPGPAWAWVEPIAAPFRAYGRMQRRSPYTTQLSSSLTIYFLGDLSAQLVAGSGTEQAYEPIRGVRALIIGGISSIPSYKWFMFLGNHFNYSSHIVSLAVKIGINQTVFTPIFNTYFFGMQSLLTGSTLKEAKQRVIDTVPVSWKNSWKVWPAVTAFSFTFVAAPYRNVFAGVIAIAWQTYLSVLNARAAREEAARLQGAQGKQTLSNGNGKRAKKALAA